MAIEIKGDRLALGAVDPESSGDKKMLDDLEAKKYEMKVVVISPSSLESAWQFYQFIKPEAETITGNRKDCEGSA